ncbi:hypothetical protein MC7420_6523 [Coleofasciculus chthonoplastes PCC 7420]|uniref:Uncharacterized protein n=1 Tax=Coleofasciculus chthonoplastes PCC 7420 TaxID=118168 RepID=B4VQY4_9CYAN|nr:hypothetical protein MC7420_6523 [Coleofasciculus chthonoplastes PCC 7420]
MEKGGFCFYVIGGEGRVLFFHYWWRRAGFVFPLLVEKGGFCFSIIGGEGRVLFFHYWWIAKFSP